MCHVLMSSQLSHNLSLLMYQLFLFLVLFAQLGQQLMCRHVTGCSRWRLLDSVWLRLMWFLTSIDRLHRHTNTHSRLHSQSINDAIHLQTTTQLHNQAANSQLWLKQPDLWQNSLHCNIQTWSQRVNNISDTLSTTQTHRWCCDFVQALKWLCVIYYKLIILHYRQTEREKESSAPVQWVDEMQMELQLEAETDYQLHVQQQLVVSHDCHRQWARLAHEGWAAPCVGPRSLLQYNTHQLASLLCSSSSTLFAKWQIIMNSWNIQHVAGCQWSIRLSTHPFLTDTVLHNGKTDNDRQHKQATCSSRNQSTYKSAQKNKQIKKNSTNRSSLCTHIISNY